MLPFGTYRSLVLEFCCVKRGGSVSNKGAENVIQNIRKLLCALVIANVARHDTRIRRCTWTCEEHATILTPYAKLARETQSGKMWQTHDEPGSRIPTK